MPSNWMIYGANGYTGVLIAEEAVRRGHRPILAGRSREKLDPIGQRLGLEVVAVDLKDWSALRTEVSRVSAVVHAAGPFVHTAEPMRRACLEAGAHYLDITGEIAVFQGSFALDKEAKKRNVAIISGVGFDVVPTDCLSKYVADRLPGAKELEIAFAALGGQTSAGTTKSMLEGAPHGNFVRRAGKLVRVPYGKGAKRVRFSQREAWAMPIPWGDLETAFRTTGIPNITTYIAVSSRVGKAMSLAWPIANAAAWAGGKALARKSVLDRAQALVERRVKGPDEALREHGRSYVWARASDGDRFAEAWLDTREGYAFTAIASVNALERVLKGGISGATTPALAFGADFVLDVPTTKRIDQV